ncbi:MAG TPA: WD40 repeat domain-containing protein, partial [Myxococcaceae bacterium]|nr:WD40 repeat domain-containing protein [Myxococcaceae bacterium]
GTPREVTENAEAADWSPAGDLAVVRQIGGTRVLEAPPEHALFRTNGWISHPRFSPRGDRIAFLHHPVASDDMGEVVVTDLEGQTRVLSKRWPVTSGLAWSPDGSEVWFTGGAYVTNALVAVTFDGTARNLYRSPTEIRLEDVAKDGRVLITSLLLRNELVYADGSGRQTLLSWTDWNTSLAALSRDGTVLFSTIQTATPAEGSQPTWAEGSTPTWATLRRTDGSPAKVLGEGFAMDLSADGRWALVTSVDYTKLTALPTGAGHPRPFSTHGLEIERARFLSDARQVLVTGRAQGEEHIRLYRLAPEASGLKPVSDVALSRGENPLHLSPDGRLAAALDEELNLVVISVQGGATQRVPQLGTDRVTARGWSPDGNLWVTEGVRSSAFPRRLLLLDPRTGKLLGERPIDKPELGGVSFANANLVLSPDGRQFALTYVRDLGSLVILRGLKARGGR